MEIGEGGRDKVVERRPGWTLRATVRYDGTNFAGWQIQPGQSTVQGNLTRALSQMVSEPISVHGAGRTDAGVHAFAQVCSFRWPKEPDLARLQRSLNRMLRPDIHISDIVVVPDNFNARFDAHGKTYAYSLFFGRDPDPFSARYAWCIPWKLDHILLKELIQRLPGTHDFAGFQCAGASVQTTVRTLYSVEMLPGGAIGPIDCSALCRIEFTGDGFLYKMVRNLTGTLIDIARGQLSVSHFDALFASAGPFRGYTAPAHGLVLMGVRYVSGQKKEAP